MSKAPEAFRTISEVAEFLETPAHVLRFWESRFPQIKPVKRAGGRRYYRPADLALLSGIRRLLHDEGMTIRGVQKILREQGVRHVSGLSEEEEMDLEGLDLAEDVEEENLTPSAPIPLFPKAAAVPEHDQPAAEPEAGAADIFAENIQADEPPEVAQHTGTTETFSALSDDPATDGANPPVADDAAPQVAEFNPAPTGAETDAGNVNEDDPAPPAVAETTTDAAPQPGFALREPDASAPSTTESEQPDFFTTLATPAADTPVEEPQNAVAQESAHSDAVNIDTASVEEDVWSNLPVTDSVTDAANVSEMPQVMATTEATDAPTDSEVLAEAAPDQDMPSEPAPIEVSQNTAPVPAPLPPMLEITGHWLPADLRALRKGALRDKRAQTTALIQRLEALRNRVGDLGRVPRR